MIEAVAWGLGTGVSVWAICGAVKSVCGKPHCEMHDEVVGIMMSDIATIKSNMMLLSSFATRQANGEGIDLNERIIQSLMRKGRPNE
jgi:hypothetical protein